jgi:ribonuclease R
MERRADEAERELVQWKKVRFMADKVGDVFDGYITGVAPFGLFVELVDHYVEGMVHISSMADDYYRYSETTHTLFGENTKKKHRLGDRVSVQVVRVDLEKRQIDLGLDDVLEAVRHERRRGARRSEARPKKERRKGTPEERRKLRQAARRRTQRPGRRERAAKKRR